MDRELPPKIQKALLWVAIAAMTAAQLARNPPLLMWVHLLAWVAMTSLGLAFVFFDDRAHRRFVIVVLAQAMHLLTLLSKGQPAIMLAMLVGLLPLGYLFFKCSVGKEK
ncbi:MAG: hypothetical protein ACO1SV_14930 [Fimbriimonas sp.]